MSVYDENRQRYLDSLKEKILHYKGNGTIPYFMVEEYTITPNTGDRDGDDSLWYAGFDFDEAMAAYHDADVAFANADKYDKKRSRIEAQLYFLSADIDVTDEDAIFNAVCEQSDEYDCFMPSISLGTGAGDLDNETLEPDICD